MAFDDRDRGGGATRYDAPSDRGGSDAIARPNAAHRDRPVDAATTPELIGRLVNDLSDLADRQIELAKQEIREEIGEAIGAAKTLAIGAGIGLITSLLLLIWAWTGFIWFFNWVGAFFNFGGLGWVLSLIVMAVLGLLAWLKFVKPGFTRAKGIRPMRRTIATLKEDLQWVQDLRTPSER